MIEYIGENWREIGLISMGVIILFQRIKIVALSNRIALYDFLR